MKWKNNQKKLILKQNNKFIILDIDGVLATSTQYYLKPTSKSWLKKFNVYPFDKKCVYVFNEILRETNAEIILSSDWRFHFNLEQLDEIFKLNNVIKSPINCTLDLSYYFENKNQISKIRQFEIKEYLKKNNIKSYVVIDDLDLSESFDKEFIRCAKENEGIKQSGIKEKIIKVLNK